MAERDGERPAARTADARVLLVDDDHDFADSLAGLLRLEGYAVRVAHDGASALRMAADGWPRVALIDIRLGHENGIDLLRALRGRHPDLIAVMITAYASIEATVGALQAGAYDYLRKPFHADELLATLARCLERSRLYEERAQAAAALQARNRELEALNKRLARVLSSLGELSRAGTPAQVARSLLDVVVRELGASGGAFYLHERGRMRRQAAAGASYPGELPWPSEAGSSAAAAMGPQLPVKTEPAVRHEERPSVGATLALPMADGEAGLAGAVLVGKDDGRGFSRQDAEVGQILVSFGAEVMRAARAVEDLARSEQRLREVVQNSPSAIALKDLQGSYLLANDRFVEWFGPDRASGEPDGMTDDAVARLGRAITRELDLLLAGARPRRLLVTRFPVLDAAGEPVGIGTIATDVTERHEAEERLRQAQRMEALGRLTGGVAHDFNNLLAVVLGNLRLVQEQCRSRPDLSEMIEDALDAARSGVELTGRLLAFGRRQPLRPEPTDLREQVLGVSRLLGRTLGERITIRLTLPPDLGHVHVDRAQLEASLLNLALNARDAMPEGGELAITVGDEELGVGGACADHEIEPGRYVALTVADTGHGMSPEVLQRAVQPFFTTKAAGAGSGLGLSMVHGFVHQSGGHLRIASEPGKGTAVTLYFPVAAGEPPVIEPTLAPADALAAGRGERVLLVEDQPKVRQLLKRQLQRLGYAVVDAADAGEALARLADSRFDLLLTDVVLPGDVDGARLGELALARDPALAVVLTTGYAAHPPADHRGAISSAPLLRKPVEPETLARTLRQELDRRRAPQAREGAST